MTTLLPRHNASNALAQRRALARPNVRRISRHGPAIRNRITIPNPMQHAQILKRHNQQSNMRLRRPTSRFPNHLNLNRTIARRHLILRSRRQVIQNVRNSRKILSPTNQIATAYRHLHLNNQIHERPLTQYGHNRRTVNHTLTTSHVSPFTFNIISTRKMINILITKSQTTMPLLSIRTTRNTRTRHNRRQLSHTQRLASSNKTIRYANLTKNISRHHRHRSLNSNLNILVANKLRRRQHHTLPHHSNILMTTRATSHRTQVSRLLSNMHHIRYRTRIQRRAYSHPTRQDDTISPINILLNSNNNSRSAR